MLAMYDHCINFSFSVVESTIVIIGGSSKIVESSKPERREHSKAKQIHLSISITMV